MRFMSPSVEVRLVGFITTRSIFRKEKGNVFPSTPKVTAESSDSDGQIKCWVAPMLEKTGGNKLDSNGATTLLTVTNHN